MSNAATFLILSSAFPIALMLWFVYIAGLHSFSSNPEDDQIPPSRWLAATLLPIIFMVWGYQRKSLSLSGAFVAIIVGFVLTISSYCFVADILVFFFTGSKLTKFRSEKKKLMEEDFKEGGQRTWVQVLCNGGMGTILALLYLTDAGVGEAPVNFSSYYRATWLSLGVLGTFACANGDTWASEVGSVVGGSPILITTGRKVPRGTNGGITLGGLLVSFLGGLTVGFGHYFTVLYFVDSSILKTSGAQWPIILVGGFAGLLGSILDSLLGATLQYSGLDKTKGCIVERPGPDIVHISGARILDNHSVNFISTVAAGILTPTITNMFW